MALVWYPGKTTRTPGLRLEPGWNAINEPTATELVERGVVLRQPPGTIQDFEDQVRGIPTADLEE